MNTLGGRLFIVIVLVLSSTAIGGIGLTGSIAAADGDVAPRIAVQENDTDADENETTAHRNPDEYSEDGDLEGVERWLEGRLTSQLSEGAIQLSEGEYERAEGYVDEEYRERLGQYVDVAGETGGESREAEFEDAADQQARLTDAVREYRKTKAEYEAAREAGNEERARELARELDTLAAEIDSLGGSLRESYAAIENETGADLSESDAAIGGVNADIQAEQTVVRSQEFEETTVTLESDRDEISFREPLLAAGELRTADGEPIANREIRLDIGNQTRHVTTDATGQFSLEYRPTTESVSADSLEIQYVPTPQSIYLGSETTVNVSISQVEPTISLDETTTSREVSYRDGATVAGSVTVDTTPVDGVPLAVLLGGERIGTANVTDGAFNGSVAVPASIPDGEQDLAVRLPFEEQALAATSETTTVTVRETASDLALEGTATDERQITVNGTLTTADGSGVAGEPIRIRVGDTTVDTVTTDADGTFTGTVAVPETVGSGDVRVRAIYDGSGSNLAPAEGETTVPVSESGTESLVPTWVTLAGGFLALLAGGLGVWWYRRSATEDPAPVGPTGDQAVTADGATAADQSLDSLPETDAVAPLLERAHEQLTNGQPDEAARTGYAAVRRALASRVGEQRALTHWEFYQAFRTDDTTDTEVLREVTQGYEQAAFGPEEMSQDETEGLLERARHLCGVDEPAETRVSADD